MELYENMDESVSHLRKNGNKEDKIPYGLFLQEKQASYKTVIGLTAEDVFFVHFTNKMMHRKLYLADGTKVRAVDADGEEHKHFKRLCVC